jgi:hypothetical protein
MSSRKDHPMGHHFYRLSPVGAKFNPDKFGVYELTDTTKQTVYFGCGKIKTQLVKHTTQKDVPKAYFYRYQILPTEEECQAKAAELIASYEQKNGKKPLYNNTP